MNIEYLKGGDLVAIAFVAKYITLKMCDFAIIQLKLAGFNLFPINKKILKREGMFSGKEEDRVGYFQQLLDHPNIKAIFFARGGYGSIKILDQLNFDKFQENPKWLVGFSDVTTILSHLKSNYNFPVVHGPMIFNFQRSSKKSLAFLFDGLQGNFTKIQFSSHSLNRKGIVEAEIVGGNLSILCSLLGSSSFPNLEGKILFIEDVDEYLYSIDRMLYSLNRARAFHNLSGLIVGKFYNIMDNTPSFGASIEELIFNQVKGFNFPVCFNFPAGHVKNNMPIFFGKKVKLCVDRKVELDYK